MKYLQHMLSRRNFLKLTAHVSMVTLSLHKVNLLAKASLQTNNPPLGYGVGNYSQGAYPGVTSTNYLPLIIKEQ